MQLIPSMDLLGGRIVRLRHGDRRWITYYDWTAEAWIERLVSAGARRIHIVDLDGAFGEARQPVFRTFPARWPGVRFQTGGGLRSREAVQGALDLGFDAVVGTLAVEAPQALEGFPGERVVLALDMKGQDLVTRGWEARASRGTEEICRTLRASGFDRALVTDVGRDGTMEGPGTAAVAKVAGLGFRVQASGGLRNLQDLAELRGIPGVVGAISGKALLDGALSLEDAAVRAAMSSEEGGA
ncbi:MAG TPA: HisA/HisF-related TIM barrel protein [Holophaga sp.]|nr:HisA/HisF-related TIM barrel protein [Holophaga sp.]